MANMSACEGNGTHSLVDISPSPRLPQLQQTTTDRLFRPDTGVIKEKTYYPGGVRSVVLDTILPPGESAATIWDYVESEYDPRRDKVPVGDLNIDFQNGLVMVDGHEFSLGDCHNTIGGNELNHVGTYGILYRAYGLEPPQGTMTLSHRLMDDSQLVRSLEDIGMLLVSSMQEPRRSLHLPVNDDTKILSHTPDYPPDIEIPEDPSTSLFISGASSGWYSAFVERVIDDGWEGNIFWSPSSRDLKNISTGSIDRKTLVKFLKVSTLVSMNQDEARILQETLGYPLCDIVPRGIITNGADDINYWEGDEVRVANPLDTQISAKGVAQIWGEAYAKNHTGCGDSFLAAVRFVWEHTGSLDSAVRVGSCIASITLGSQNSNLMEVPPSSYPHISRHLMAVL